MPRFDFAPVVVMALVAERKEPLLHHQHYHHYLQGSYIVLG
jgi:hypothetical protein